MEYFSVGLKTIVIYLAMIILLRVLGKREVGKLSTFDLVIILVVADIASIGLDNSDFFFLSIFSLAVLVCLQKILSKFLLHNAKFRFLVDSKPTIIVKDGRLILKNMYKEKYTIDDLIMQMRMENIMNIEDIKLAILETNGTLSIFSDVNSISSLPVISSGIIMDEGLEVLNIKKDVIIDTFLNNGVLLENILFASIKSNEIYFYERTNNKEEELAMKKLRLIEKSDIDC